MTTQTSTKVRLVKCPRCRGILAEWPNVSLYECGGCGTTLQAKIRGQDANHAESSSRDRDILPRMQLDGVVEEKEARSVAGDSIRPPSLESSPDNDGIKCCEDGGESSLGLSSQEKYDVVQEKEGESLNGYSARSCSVESSPEKDNLSCHDNRLNYSLDASNGRIVTDDCSSSLGVDHVNDVVVEVTQPGKDDVHVNNSLEVSNGRSVINRCPSSLEVDHGSDAALEVKESLKPDGSLTKTCGKSDGKSRGGSGEWSGSTSDGVLSLGEFICETESDAPEANVPVEPIEKNDAHRVDQMEGREPLMVWQEEDDDDVIDEIQHLPDLEDEKAIFAGDSEDREVDEHGYVALQNVEKRRLSSAGQSEVSDEGVSPIRLDSNSGLSEAQHIEVGAEEQHIKVDGEAEVKTNGGTCHPIVTSQRSWNESLASFYLTCAEDEHTDHSVRESTLNYERISSIDTLASSSLTDLSSELVSKYLSMNNFRPKSNYYAYDGSESSYDGTDDQIHEHFPTRREKVGRDGLVDQSKAEGSYWASGSPRRATKIGHSESEKSTEVIDYMNRFNTRLNKHGDASRLRHTFRDPVPSHKAVSPSRYRHSLLPPRPGFNSSDKVLYSEADKVDLLRRVYELRDQLSRIHLPLVATGRRYPPGIPVGKFNLSHYDHIASEEDLCSDRSRHVGLYHLQCDAPEGYIKGCGISRQAFSDEVAHYRNQHGCSCLHCRHQDRHYSAHLPARARKCRNSCCGASPQYDTSSELSLWGCETEPDDQIRCDAIKRLRLKEKFHSVKQHLLPVSGGAPLISCYKCWELLQLPVDFLLFKRRCHRLRCNACCEVLKFSLLKGTRLVPYVPVVSNPPPSMAVGYDDKAAKPRIPGPTSCSGSCQHVEDAISCSDHYKQSFCRSCSDGETSVISASVNQASKDSYNRKMSGSSSEPAKNSKMKLVLREDQQTNGTRSRGPSSQKGTSEIEEVLPSLSNSPLHRLMGYSSTSQVFIK